MYVVTFYSYKGGVGRTMALANVASTLVSKGKRVLVVDFDLEAPGLPSYEMFHCGTDRVGVVDYISEYIDTLSSPDISDFIYECEPGLLWLMGAGKYETNEYSRKLSGIDWSELYNLYDGYLMFEDLRQQWENFEGHGFDYVLIDSRTGHTDVGGICTRQLPDAVVAMFLPNRQNIMGLKTVVEEIRADKVTRADRPVRLHFCPSNVPDLDDENAILSDLMSLAQTELSYASPASVIHSYPSLQILQQVSFVSSRPNSKIAKEYLELTTSIEASNLRDLEGATIALRKILASLRKARESRSRALLDEWDLQVREIQLYHGSVPRIAWLLAQVFDELGRPEEEIAALTVSIQGGENVDAARMARASTLSNLNDTEGARSDLLSVLASRNATEFELVPAIEMLRPITQADAWADAISKSPAIATLEPSAVLFIANSLMSDRAGLPTAIELCRAVMRVENLSDSLRAIASEQFVLSAIGARRYSEAIEELNAHVSDISLSNDISDVFNYGVAVWGLMKDPPLDVFRRVVELGSERIGSSTSANFYQCLSLSEALTGDREKALDHLASARQNVKQVTRQFSCWSYLNFQGSKMNDDLDEMRAAISGGGILALPFF